LNDGSFHGETDLKLTLRFTAAAMPARSRFISVAGNRFLPVNVDAAIRHALA
jgi:hypothetical protein